MVQDETQEVAMDVEDYADLLGFAKVPDKAEEAAEEDTIEAFNTLEEVSTAAPTPFRIALTPFSRPPPSRPA